MFNAFIIVPVAAGAYIATNLDNLVLLVSLLGRYRGGKTQVIAGYFACVLLLTLMGFWLAAAADRAPVQYLGFLGIVPIALGLAGIVQLFRNSNGTAGSGDKPISSGRSAFMATLLVQLSNGTDTVVTFGALFTDSAASLNLMIIVTLGSMAAIFVMLATYATEHPRLNEWLDRNGPRITPFILIVVGAYILANTGTDVMPG